MLRSVSPELIPESMESRDITNSLLFARCDGIYLMLVVFWGQLHGDLDIASIPGYTPQEK